ncbi:50S ribosomal protein L10 [Candidatus Woesebacteria bacterium GWA1_41_8]|uniref:Large ribosomal subunit protein uL10 n=1 Tax=Candidatus Woesebacteria bacterium GWA1_41_8 TaxID=1802471 RepID=A0A1F7WJC8_9BACT|nr:MAG: 50S ribosomal protein L10 [Candidatus Woesebacteria bacterium GWA1_41_8]
MKKAEKPIFVENLAAELASAKTVVLINFAGLSVKSQQELKRRLLDVDAKMIVVKNTLLKRAGGVAKIPSDTLSDSALTGQTALVIGASDPIAPVQVLGKFAAEFEVPSFKVGIIEGAFQDTDSLIKISKLPAKDALLGQLLGTLLSSSYGLVGTLNSNMQSLLYILKQRAG